MKLFFLSSRLFSKARVLFAILVVFSSLVFAQEADKSADTAANSSAPMESSTTVSNSGAESSPSTKIDESKILLNIGSTGNEGASTLYTTGSSTSGSFFSTLLKFVVVLGFVCVLAYFFLRFLKKAQFGTADDPYLKIAASLKVAPNKTIYIVVIKREAFLIAVTEKDITLLSKIQDEELIDTLNLASENYATEQKSFSEVLSSLFNKGSVNSAKKTHTTSDDTVAQDFLSSMRNRLHNSEQKGE